jgi:UDP-N-acetylmuramate--alanine ligase
VSTLDLSRPVKIHVVGAGGAGMSAIATVLVSMGHEVSGSDQRASTALERLRAAGVRVEVGHRPENLGQADHVTISTAVPESNPEVVEARRRGIPVHDRASALRAITSLRRTIAVAGTHGKTTTASMLSLCLVEAELRPSFVIGGDLNDIGGNAVWGYGEWMVVEADESDGTFLVLDPAVAVVTNLEPDHLDHYGDLTGLRDAFARFAAGATAMSVLSADDPGARELAEPLEGAVTFGFSPGATYQVTAFEGHRSWSSFDLSRRGEPLGRFTLPMPGMHNARNACAAAAVAVEIGAPTDDVRRALARFAGVARRFEFRGELNGVTLVDDYAHLPGEVAAALAAARLGGFERVVCVFQPHRYSRTQSLWRAFADAFVDADLLAVTQIYSAGEELRPGVTGKLVLDAVRSAHPEAEAVYLPTRAEVLEWLERVLRPGDICLTLGAGDLTSVPDELLDRGRA